MACQGHEVDRLSLLGLIGLIIFLLPGLACGGKHQGPRADAALDVQQVEHVDYLVVGDISDGDRIEFELLSFGQSALLKVLLCGTTLACHTLWQTPSANDVYNNTGIVSIITIIIAKAFW